MSEVFGIALTVVGFILFAQLIAGCKWTDTPEPKGNDEPWDTQI